MRWTVFAILAAITIVCQTTLVQMLFTFNLTVGDIDPDWMFVLAVYYALWGPWPDAAIAAWILGLVMDLSSLGRTGLLAFCYGAAAWAIIRARHVVFREHPLTQFLITLLFGLGVQLAVVLYDRWMVENGAVPGAWRAALLKAVYTAAFAPLLHWVLLRLSFLTGLRPARREWLVKRSG